MPLSLGGGIRTAADAELLLRHGADKVVVNTEAHRSPDLVSAIAGKFGSQAVVVSIDARFCESDGRFVLYSDCGRRAESTPLEAHVERMQNHGAGEILVNSIDTDGTMSGYDLRLIRAVVAACSIPVIGCGGAGHYEHMREAFLATGVQALACGSLFNFGDNNPIRAKAFLSHYGIPFKVV
jgi:cyclase